MTNRCGLHAIDVDHTAVTGVLALIRSSSTRLAAVPVPVPVLVLVEATQLVGRCRCRLSRKIVNIAKVRMIPKRAVEETNYLIGAFKADSQMYIDDPIDAFKENHHLAHDGF